MISNVFCPPPSGIPVFVTQIWNESFHISNIEIVLIVFLFFSGIVSNSIPISIPNTTYCTAAAASRES